MTLHFNFRVRFVFVHRRSNLPIGQSVLTVHATSAEDAFKNAINERSWRYRSDIFARIFITDLESGDISYMTM